MSMFKIEIYYSKYCIVFDVEGNSVHEAVKKAIESGQGCDTTLWTGESSFDSAREAARSVKLTLKTPGWFDYKALTNAASDDDYDKFCEAAQSEEEVLVFEIGG
jgi:hypothetical protein